jgi:hypothetical protein
VEELKLLLENVFQIRLPLVDQLDERLEKIVSR